jgi:hypothetical protein
VNDSAPGECIILVHPGAGCLVTVRAAVGVERAAGAGSLMVAAWPMNAANVVISNVLKGAFSSKNFLANIRLIALKFQRLTPLESPEFRELSNHRCLTIGGCWVFVMKTSFSEKRVNI